MPDPEEQDDSTQDDQTEPDNPEPTDGDGGGGQDEPTDEEDLVRQARKLIADHDGQVAAMVKLLEENYEFRQARREAENKAEELSERLDELEEKMSDTDNDDGQDVDLDELKQEKQDEILDELGVDSLDEARKALNEREQLRREQALTQAADVAGVDKGGLKLVATNRDVEFVIQETDDGTELKVDTGEGEVAFEDFAEDLKAPEKRALAPEVESDTDDDDDSSGIRWPSQSSEGAEPDDDTPLAAQHVERRFGVPGTN